MATVKFPKQLFVTEERDGKGDDSFFVANETHFEAVHANGWSAEPEPVAVYVLKEVQQSRFVVESSPAKPKRKR